MIVSCKFVCFWLLVLPLSSQENASDVAQNWVVCRTLPNQNSCSGLAIGHSLQPPFKENSDAAYFGHDGLALLAIFLEPLQLLDLKRFQELFGQACQ